MRPALAALWAAYAQQSVHSDTPFLERATRCCGARLVQTAYEASQLTAHLTTASVLHVQVAANIFRRPLAAATNLLGLTTRQLEPVS
jgi:hypothetical protein